jgi:hypothetical protein
MKTIENILLKILLAGFFIFAWSGVAMADAWDECYSPDWYYDAIDPSYNYCGPHHTEPDPAPMPLDEGTLDYSSYHLWYCQARPVCEQGFHYREYQSYQERRGDARDQALFRCERITGGRCASRCALLPRVCAPHFWQ